MTQQMSPVVGSVEPGFENLAAAFAEVAAQDPEGGVSLSVVRRGETLVDLASGWVDAAGEQSWDVDTPVCVFSVTKAVLAALAYQLSQEGVLDFDVPVSTYWPEFAAAGKAGITVRELFSHRAGLLSLSEDLTTSDVIAWDPVIHALEKQEPLWKPGTAFGYHALTYGWLVGEVLRRVTGKTPGVLLRERFGEAGLGLDMWLGAPSDVLDRRARLVPAPPLDFETLAPETRALLEGFMKPEVVRSMTLGGAFPMMLFEPGEGLDAKDVLAAEVPAAGIVATARALATLFDRCAQPGGLLTAESLADIQVIRSEGDFWGGASSPETRFSTGFMVGGLPQREFLSARSFGHDGALGEVVFADPDAGLGFAYLTRRSLGFDDARSGLLVDALRADLAAQDRRLVSSSR